MSNNQIFTVFAGAGAAVLIASFIFLRDYLRANKGQDPDGHSPSTIFSSFFFAVIVTAILLVTFIYFFFVKSS
ncbi:hypothetical protein [Acinetobacter junii]|uniref:hypothetical protein n=1 Tax=Acinetobacter junii TaxID=40215 RepID=UPI0002CDF53D|nr:hypothetical protein [Acinetobacter junii]ENV52041.1 hypothetical protein F953_00531 [Acinetobacter junii CIP 107470 = MTCC 11364]